MRRDLTVLDCIGEALCPLVMAAVWTADRPAWLVRQALRGLERLDERYADRVNPRWER